jgi:hypothetical protein
VWPRPLPSSVYPKGVASACENCSTFLLIKWSSRSSLPIICCHKPSGPSSETETLVRMDFLFEFGLTWPRIFLPSFLKDPCVFLLFSRALTSSSIFSSLSMAHAALSSTIQILIQKKVEKIVFDSDAKGCYNRIISGISLACLKRIGYLSNSV